MRVATFEVQGRQRVGSVTPDGSAIAPFELATEDAALGVLALIRHANSGQPVNLEKQSRGVDEVRLVAPIPRPVRNIFCIGKNYREHIEEFAGSGFDSSGTTVAVPVAPIVFSKVPECVTAPGAPIRIDPAVSEAVDYEAELAVIIGRGGRAIPRERAFDYVWGYTIVNDVTARDIQGRHNQWLLGKSQDTFCPMGPWIVTAESVDAADLAIRCWVNGELRQESNTRHLIFDIPTLIATISAGVTLLPGDIIATGTPAGVGVGFNPPRYLKPGDVVRIEIPGIGVLENPVST